MCSSRPSIRLDTSGGRCGSMSQMDYENFSKKDREDLIEFELQMARVVSWEGMHETTLGGVMQLTDNTSATNNETDDSLTLVNCPTLGDADQKDVDRSIDFINERIPHDHAVHQMVDLTDPATGVFQRSDFMSDQAFKETPLYQEAYKHLGEFQQLCCPIYSGSAGNLLLTLGRDGQKYSERDKRIVMAVRQIVQQKCIQLAKSAQLQETVAIQDSAIRGHTGLICLNSSLRVEHMNEVAARLINGYFKELPGPGKLPEKLELFVQRRWYAKTGFPKWKIEPTTVALREGYEPLQALLMTGLTKDHRLLILTVPNSATPPPHYRWSNITKRQKEVLALFITGLSRGQIATRLGIAENTVNHHLKSIATKMGLENKDRLNILIEYKRDFG